MEDRNRIADLTMSTLQDIDRAFGERFPHDIAELDPAMFSQGADGMIFTMYMLSLFKDAVDKTAMTTPIEMTTLIMCFAESIERLREKGVAIVAEHRKKIEAH